jgi:hypothetical protein
MLVAVAAAATFAQSPTYLKADVPFDFWVGNANMPAGRYLVGRGPASVTAMIQSEDGKNAAIVLTQGKTSVAWHEKGSLVFHRYGNVYILSEIWASGNDGRQLPPTKRENELAKGLAAPPSETVAAVR